MLSDICLARKQYRQAIAYLERGLKHSTDGNPDLKEKLGILYYFSGAYRKSQILLDEVVRLNPMREQSHLFLGHDYFELKEYDDALKEYQWILANSQTDEMHYARLYLSRTYSRLSEEAKLFHGHNGEYQRKLAEQQLEQVLFILPNDSRVYFSIANTMVDLDRFAEARSYFEMVVEDDPDFAAALNNLSWLLSTATDTSFREPKRSLDYADKCVRLTNAQKDIYLDTLAEAYYKDGQYDKAIDVIHEAILINPLNDYYHQQLQRFQKAKKGYQQKTGGRIFLQAVNPGSIYSF
jgi:tetratricopeptide (TPR) repeat protein